MGGGPQLGFSGVREHAQYFLSRGADAANKGDYKVARLQFENALKVTGDLPAMRSHALLCLGDVAFDQSQYKTAEQFYNRSMKGLQKVGITDTRLIIAKGRFSKARISQDLGYPQHAHSLAEDALGAFEELQQYDLAAIGYNLFGVLAWQQGDKRKGLNYINKSIKIKEQNNMTRGVAASKMLRALITARAQGQNPFCTSSSLDDLRNARGTYEAGDVNGLAKTSYVFGRVFECTPLHQNQAVGWYAKTLELCDKHHFLKGKAVALQGLARTAQYDFFGEERPLSASEYHSEAVKIFKKLGCNPAHIPKTPSSLDKILETFV